MTTDNTTLISAKEYNDILMASFVQRYHTKNDVWSNEDAMREVSTYLLEYMGDQKAQHVLDIGTGQGKDAEILLNAGHYVTGIDLYEHEAWDFLRITWGEMVHLVKTQFTDWQPFPKKKFDVVLDNGCFHHQHPTVYSSYLAHLKHLLKPNGIAMFSVFTPIEENMDSYYKKFDIGRIGRYFNSDELQQLLTNNDLTWLDSRRIYRPGWNEYYLVALVKNQH